MQSSQIQIRSDTDEKVIFSPRTGSMSGMISARRSPNHSSSLVTGTVTNLLPWPPRSVWSFSVQRFVNMTMNSVIIVYWSVPIDQDGVGTNSRCRGNRSRSLGWKPVKTTKDMLASIKPEVKLILKAQGQKWSLASSYKVGIVVSVPSCIQAFQD